MNPGILIVWYILAAFLKASIKLSVHKAFACIQLCMMKCMYTETNKVSWRRATMFMLIEHKLKKVTILILRDSLVKVIILCMKNPRT